MKFSDISNFLFGKKEIRVLTQLDEEQIRRDKVIQEARQDVAARDAQLAIIAAKNKKDKDKEKDKEKENELNKKLNEQYEDLKAKKHGKIISLDKFYYHVFFGKPLPPRADIRKYYSEWAKNIEFRDKDNISVLGKYGGMGIMEGGKLCFRDAEGDLISYGKTLNHILFKPDAFENYARDKKFLLPVNKDGIWGTELEYEEIPEPIDFRFDEETGKIKKIIWSKIKLSEVYKVIARLKEESRQIEEDLERQENVNIKLKQENYNLKRSLFSANEEYGIVQSELSLNLNKFLESDKRFGEMNMQIIKLTELKAVYENIIDKKDDIINQVVKKLELTGEPKSDLIKKEIIQDIKTYQSILPEQIPFIPQEIKKEIAVPMQPGEKIRT